MKVTSDCEVQFYKGAKVDGRVCTCIQVRHPENKPPFEFYQARVFVDDELNVPVRYAAWDWPATPGGQPVLLEEYTYLNLKVNQGFTDADFNHQGR